MQLQKLLEDLNNHEVHFVQQTDQSLNAVYGFIEFYRETALITLCSPRKFTYHNLRGGFVGTNVYYTEVDEVFNFIV